MENVQVRRDFIVGTRRLENYFWSLLLFFGGVGFVAKGLIDLLATKAEQFTQPVVMIFYGYIALCLCLYLVCSIVWNVGAGYNEFNKQTREMKLVRWGFPGKYRRIIVTVPFQELQEVSIQSQTFGLQPNSISISCKNGQKLPVLQTNLTLGQLEYYATQIAYYLQLPLKDTTLI